jgi:hypothetical protein
MDKQPNKWSYFGLHECMQAMPSLHLRFDQDMLILTTKQPHSARLVHGTELCCKQSREQRLMGGRSAVTLWSVWFEE